MNTFQNHHSGGADAPQSTCPVSGLPIITRPEWTDLGPSDNYRVTFRLIGGRIIHAIPRGTPDGDNLEAMFRFARDMADGMHRERKAFVVIDDYTRVNDTPSRSVRRQMVDGLLRNHQRLLGYIGFNMSFRMKLAMKVSRRLFKFPFPVMAAKDYEAAVNLALALLKESPADGGSPWQAKMPLTSDRTDHDLSNQAIDELLHHLGSINWEIKGREVAPEKSEDDPLKPVYEAVALIKADVDDLFLKHRKAERELQETVARESGIKAQLDIFRRFIESSGEGMGWSDLDGKLVYVNETMRRILGEESLEKARGKYVTLYHDREERRRIFGDILPIVEREGGWKGELTVCNSKGQRLPTLNDIFVIRDESGQVRYHAIIARDISDLKNAEQALRESEEKYRLLVNNAGDAICIAQDGVLKFVNPRLVTLLEYPPAELSRRPFVDLIHPEDAPLIRKYYQQRLDGEKTPGPYSFRVFSKSGRMLWVQNNTVRINWEGRPAVLNFIRDITRQKSMEDHLRQTLKMEAIGTLAGGIAHDFNNILAAVMGYTEVVLGETPQGTRSYRNLRQIRKAVMRARGLVRQILTFSRPGEEVLKPLQLSPIVKEVLKMIKATVPVGVDIIQDLAAGGITVMAEPTQIHEVVMNLCTNAIQAMSQGGTLSVGMTRVRLDAAQLPGHKNISPGQFVRLTIRDTGPGMSPDIGRRVFEPYFTTRPHGEGTGLGLSVVHGIVENLGGFITVDSRIDVGTVFEVYLPTVETVESDWEAVSVERPLPGGRERIFLIDNDPQLIDSGRQMLEHLGYVVETSSDPLAAWEVLQARAMAFDLVITDMEMPKMSGDELAAAIYKISPQLPVILYSGNDMNICRMEGAGIRKFLTKPFIAADLAWAIREVLDFKA